MPPRKIGYGRATRLSKEERRDKAMSKKIIKAFLESRPDPSKDVPSEIRIEIYKSKPLVPVIRGQEFIF